MSRPPAGPSAAPPPYFPAETAAPELAAQLDAFLGALAADLAAQPWSGRIAALVLGGGYGRGEGGVHADGDGPPRLYNDLEFYLFTRGRGGPPEAAAWCERWSLLGGERSGIAVEFKRQPVAGLARAEPTMFLHDLIAAHRVVWGDRHVLHNLPPRLRDAARIPAAEAARLLFNRGSGLFFSRIALQRGDERVRDGFVERNHAKARLALADAVLAWNGRHHHLVRERARRLAFPLVDTPPEWPRLLRWHAEGLAFKLHPRHRQPPAEELAREQEELSRVWRQTFLWLEAQRLRRPLPDPAAYLAAPGPLFPGRSPLRNRLLRLRDRLRRGGALPEEADYPRAPLQRALVAGLQPEPGWDAMRRLLRLPADADPGAIHDTYRRWWEFYH